MQISENLLRVIFMLSTIVAVTDCCSSRILLLKEHTLQIVQDQHRFQASGDDYDYGLNDYDQLQQQQQQKIQQHIVPSASNMEYNKNYTDTTTHNSEDNAQDDGNVADERQTISASNGNLREEEEFKSLLGIFDAAAYVTTATNGGSITTSAAAAAPGITTVPVPSPPDTSMSDLAAVRDRVVDILSIPCSGQFVTDFCLNRGRCFRYLVGNDTLHSCVCADGYIGERCESKSMNGAYVPSIAGANKQHKILMARIVFSFPMLVALSVIYIMIGAAIVFKRPPSSKCGLKQQQRRAAGLLDANMDEELELELQSELELEPECLLLNSYTD